MLEDAAANTRQAVDADRGRFLYRVLCPAQTPMLPQLNVHPSRQPDLRSPDTIFSSPPLAMSAYLDLYGNRVTRLDAPPARRISEPLCPGLFRPAGGDPARHGIVLVASPPNDVLPYSVPADTATARSSRISRRRLGAHRRGRRVQAISMTSIRKIRFSHADARATRCASDPWTRASACRLRGSRHRLCRCVIFPPAIAPAILATPPRRRIPTPWISAHWFEVFFDGRWFTFDARHNIPESAGSSWDVAVTRPMSRSRPVWLRPSLRISKLTTFELAVDGVEKKLVAARLWPLLFVRRPAVDLASRSASSAGRRPFSPAEASSSRRNRPHPSCQAAHCPTLSARRKRAIY